MALRTSTIPTTVGKGMMQRRRPGSRLLQLRYEPQTRQKKAAIAAFCSALQPRLNKIVAILSFPSLQHLVVAALGLNHLVGVRVLVDLDSTGFALGSCPRTEDFPAAR